MDELNRPGVEMLVIVRNTALQRCVPRRSANATPASTASPSLRGFSARRLRLPQPATADRRDCDGGDRHPCAYEGHFSRSPLNLEVHPVRARLVEFVEKALPPALSWRPPASTGSRHDAGVDTSCSVAPTRC